MQDHYDRCSATHFHSRIERPTLVINGLDDSFMAPDVVPGPDKLSSAVTIEIAENGGHVGFISGGWPWRPTFVLPDRIIEFLEPHAAITAL